MVTCFICLLVGENCSFHIQFNCVSSLTHFSAQIFVELNDSWQPQWFPWFCLFCICNRLETVLGSRDRETAIESRGKWGEKTPLELDESSDSQQGTRETRPRTS